MVVTGIVRTDDKVRIGYQERRATIQIGDLPRIVYAMGDVKIFRRTARRGLSAWDALPEIIERTVALHKCRVEYQLAVCGQPRSSRLAALVKALLGVPFEGSALREGFKKGEAYCQNLEGRG